MHKHLNLTDETTVTKLVFSGGTRRSERKTKKEIQTERDKLGIKVLGGQELIIIPDSRA